MDLGREKSCLTNLIAFYKEMTRLVGDGRAVAVMVFKCGF